VNALRCQKSDGQRPASQQPQLSRNAADFSISPPTARAGPLRLGGLLAIVLAIELVWALSTAREARLGAESVSSVAAIGRALFREYAFPFEVTSVLILVAMLGAVVLARPDRPRTGRSSASSGGSAGA